MHAYGHACRHVHRSGHGSAVAHTHAFNCIGHIYIGHTSIDHSYCRPLLLCALHTPMLITYNYIGHNYYGHNCIGHNYYRPLLLYALHTPMPITI